MVEKSKRSARTYGQFCALARSLDVVGDRWTLLIVRELLAGPMRYADLRRSLAGIATNLLADRLRSLEENGLVERTPRPGGVEYQLTPRGSELREAMEALGRWGTPLLAAGQGDDSFQPRWLVLAIPALLRGVTSKRPVTLGLEVDGFLIELTVDRAGASARAGVGERPATVLTASPDVVVALAARSMAVDAAISAATLEGDDAPLRAAFGTLPG